MTRARLSRTLCIVLLGSLAALAATASGLGRAPEPDRHLGPLPNIPREVNGDKLADVLVTDFGADANGRKDSGSAFVVFGKRDTRTVRRTRLGKHGFRIDGAAPGDEAGYEAEVVGDVGGDRLADVAVVADQASNNGRDSSGSAYVVFGKRDTAAVDLAQLGQKGFRIDGPQTSDYLYLAKGIADMNGDGLGDLLIGACGTDFNGRKDSGADVLLAQIVPGTEFPGRAYVIFGHKESMSIDVERPGRHGFHITPERGDAWFGIDAAGLGDLNGDRVPDLFVGTGASVYGYVLYGARRRRTISARHLGRRGFRVKDFKTDRRLVQPDGVQGKAAGDVNGDGRPDLLATVDGPDEHYAFVVLRPRPGGTLNLRRLRSRGFAIVK